METIEVVTDEDGVSLEISLTALADMVGEQKILRPDKSIRPFGYLAALALETAERNDYDIERTLMEFIRNSSSIEITPEDCDEIELILRGNQ